MNLFYASFGSCRRQGGSKQKCYSYASNVVSTYGRSSRKAGKRCKFGRTKSGKCRKTRR